MLQGSGREEFHLKWGSIRESYGENDSGAGL